MKHYLAALIALSSILSGCGRTDPPAAEPAPAAPMQQQGLSVPAAPLPDRPAPDVAKAPVTEYPKPGQTNNHSIPDFKGGTASDQK